MAGVASPDEHIVGAGVVVEVEEGFAYEDQDSALSLGWHPREITSWLSQRH